MIVRTVALAASVRFHFADFPKHRKRPVAKNQNTFEKRRREIEKKQRAEEKRKRRQTKKDSGAAPVPRTTIPPDDSTE